MTSWFPVASSRKPERMISGDLSVSRVEGLAAVLRYAADIDRLNAAADRPNPFLSSAFLHCYALRCEYFVPGSGEFLLLVRRAKDIVGILPLRRSRSAILPAALGPLALTTPRVEFLAPLDTEQPRLLCAPADEESVARAVVDYLCNQEQSFGMLEFAGQLPGGALHRALHAVPRNDWRFRARDITVEPICEVPLAWPDVKSYFRSLNKHMRSNISRQARRLYASGEVELVLARGAEATSAWYECYCDVDDRSWKRNTAASISRHPRRLRFYEDLVQGRAGLEPSFVGVVLDGALIGGLILGSNQAASPRHHGSWALEMAYDRTQAALGPGQLLLMLALAEGIQQGSAFLNMMQNFAYYKHRWGASLIDVVNVQLIRHLSLQAARAGARDVRNWWRLRHEQPQKTAGAPASADEVSHLPTEGSNGEARGERDQRTPVDVEHARSLTRAAFARSGAGLSRLDRAQARSYLPFDLE